jgi:thioredoxin-related protein
MRVSVEVLVKSTLYALFVVLLAALSAAAQNNGAPEIKPAAKEAGTSPAKVADESAGALRWHGDLKVAQKEALSCGKYVLADVFTDWCHWCTKLDKETFRDPALMAYLKEKFVLARINPEVNSDNAEVSDKYDVQGFPCALVFDARGNLLGKISGFKSAGDYQAALEGLTAARASANSSSY